MANLLKSSFFVPCMLSVTILFCQQKEGNFLMNETSPYLLAHRFNPVAWYPWKDMALTKAREENKLLVISVGYAACHWCHVMEEESFSDMEVANVMNRDFVSIKVDREERQDIDHIYMDACRLLNEDCGWPLNIIALPDGKPLFVTTYQPKENWIKILKSISAAYRDKGPEIEKQALLIQKEIVMANTLKSRDKEIMNSREIERVIEAWLKEMDEQYGGYSGSPKFPLPSSLEALLNYYFYSKDEKVLNALTQSLDGMAYGGIYDHLGGGFSRYAVDEKWKVPHFEKMLYDNAQLITLYSRAYQLTKKDLYKAVVYQSISFMMKEMRTDEGLFIASVDADSQDGEEGGYYTWTYDEIESVLKENTGAFVRHFNLREEGNWERGKNILYKDIHTVPVDDASLIRKLSADLLKERDKREAPRKDTKVLTDWNALMIKALVAAYRVFNEEKWLQAAILASDKIFNQQLKDGVLFHRYLGKTTAVKGFLDDYSYTIEAFLALYEATFDKVWLDRALELLELAEGNFDISADNGLFYFKSNKDEKLFADKMILNDHVVPSGNAVMCANYLKMGYYFDSEAYADRATEMLLAVNPLIKEHNRHYAHWLNSFLWKGQEPHEVVIMGEEAIDRRKELDRFYFPNVLLAGSENKEYLFLMEGKLVAGETIIYVCKNGMCKLPTSETQAAVAQINN